MIAARENEVLRRSFHKASQGGFTLIELMVVIGILAVIIAISLPQLTAYKYRGYRADLNTNLRNAYTAAQAYFSETPTGIVTTEDVLTKYGYKRSPSVVLATANLSMGAGQITLTHQALPSGSQTGNVDNNGIITMPTQ